MDEQEDIEFIENDEDGSETSIHAKIKKLRDKIAALEKEKQEYIDGWQRSRADYINMVKGQEEDKKLLRSQAEQGFIMDFLPVVDSFYSAFNNKEAWEAVEPNWRIGVEYIYQQLLNALDIHGVRAYGDINDQFDPTKHDAVSETETDDESLNGKISKVLQKGFTHNGKVIRAARVSVYTLKAN